MKIVFWYWWALGAVLLIFEMLLPGVVFMFLAIGALGQLRRLDDAETCLKIGRAHV